MNIRTSHAATHFQLPKSVVYIAAITIGLIISLELLARAVEYFTLTAPTGATLEYVPERVLSEADQLKAEHRYWDRYMRHDPYLVFSPIPGWRGRYTHYNSLGFRGAEIPERKPPQVVRVAVLGGSTAFGAFVKDEQTFPAVLQDLFQEALANPSANASRRKVQMINAAVPGYVSTQELIALHLKLLPLTPDLVIIFDGLNDVFNLGGRLQGTWRMDEWESRCTLPMRKRIIPFMRRWSALLRLSGRVRAALAVGRNQPTPQWVLEPGAFEGSTSVYLENLRSMLSLLRSRNINGVTILQPARLWAMSERDMQGETHLPLERVRAMRSMRETLKQAIPGVIAQFGTGFSLMDLDDISQVPDFFVEGDDIHLTEAGNRAVARRIADFLLTQRH